MPELKRVAVACAIALLTLAAAPAHAIVLTHVVGPMDNLYNLTAWPGSPFPPGNASEVGAPARSVEDGGSPFDFSGYSSVDVSATGCIVDNGTQCTGPDGIPGSPFRLLDVYSLIGVWSSTGSFITPIGNAFNIGSSETLSVPGGPAYLFLAENDGIFGDNTDGHYDVTINAVPEPTSLSLLALGGALVAARRRRRQA